MPTNEFQVGDIVQLKSGGQTITVTETENHMVWGIYWNEDQKAFTPCGGFDYRTLVKVEKTQ